MRDLIAEMDAPLDRSWVDDAACREHPGLPWFGESVAAIEACATVCRRCLVAEECHDYAADIAAPFGTWAGESRGPSRRR